MEKELLDLDPCSAWVGACGAVKSPHGPHVWVPLSGSERPEVDGVPRTPAQAKAAANLAVYEWCDVEVFSPATDIGKEVAKKIAQAR